MANIRKRPSGSWQASVYVGMINGKRSFEYITRATKQECKSAAAELELEIEQGKFKQVSHITLGEAMDKYIDSITTTLSPTTRGSYKMYANKTFTPLREYSVKKITSEDIQMFYATARCDVSSKTIRNEHSFLTVVLARYLGVKNPCRNVVLPKATNYLYKTLSNEQIKTLIEKIKGDKVEVPVLLAMWCGLRRGEVAGLRWEDVDFDNELLYIQQTLVKAEGGHVVKTPKSFSGTRVVALPEYVANKLKPMKATAKSELVVGSMGNTIYHQFKAFLKATPELPDIRFHDLRHICGTIMMSQGVPDLYASKMLGHSNTRTTKIYQHVRTEEHKKSQKILDDFFLGIMK